MEENHKRGGEEFPGFLEQKEEHHDVEELVGEAAVVKWILSSGNPVATPVGENLEEQYNPAAQSSPPYIGRGETLSRAIGITRYEPISSKSRNWRRNKKTNCHRQTKQSKAQIH